MHDPTAAVYKTGVTKTGLPISWYKDLQDVPKGEIISLLSHKGHLRKG